METQQAGTDTGSARLSIRRLVLNAMETRGFTFPSDFSQVPWHANLPTTSSSIKNKQINKIIIIKCMTLPLY